VLLWQYHGGDNQLFYFERRFTAPKPKGLMVDNWEYPRDFGVIRAKHSRKVLDARSAENGTEIIQWDEDGSEGQHWSFSVPPGGAFGSNFPTLLIHNRRTLRLLDVDCGRVVNGTKVQVWDKAGSNQYFKAGVPK